MNRKEYERAIRDTRKQLYKGNLGGVAVGILRALVAHNDPGEPQGPRQLKAAPRVRKVGAKKRRS